MPVQEENNIPIKRKKKKKKRNFGFLYLFAFAFIGALFLMTNLIKSYSPDIDVSIGANESISLTDSDTEVDIKSVDERLKWIQMEDDLPTVSVKESELNNDQIKDFDDINPVEVTPDKIKEKQDKTDINENKIIKSPPKPDITDIRNYKAETDNASKSKVKAVIPQPSSSVTKVYLGNYPNIEEAMTAQSRINSEDPSLMPFVKAVNGTYIVQLGSFSDSDKASSLVNKLREKGYSPKVIVEK